MQILEGGIHPEPSNWPVAIMKVLRKDNQEIIHIDFDKKDEDASGPQNMSDSSQNGHV